MSLLEPSMQMPMTAVKIMQQRLLQAKKVIMVLTRILTIKSFNRYYNLFSYLLTQDIGTAKIQV